MQEEAQPTGRRLPDWSSRPRPPRTAMHGRFCRVEPLRICRSSSGVGDVIASVALTVWHDVGQRLHT